MTTESHTFSGDVTASGRFNGSGAGLSNGTVPRASMAAGTANHVVINDGSGGLLTSEATLALSRGGTNAALAADATKNIVLTLPALGSSVSASVQYTSSLVNSSIVSRGASGEVAVGALTSNDVTVANGSLYTMSGAPPATAKVLPTPTANVVMHAYATARTTGASQNPAIFTINTSADYASTVEVLVVVSQDTAASTATGVIKLIQRFQRTTLGGLSVVAPATMKVVDLDPGVSTVDVDLIVSGLNVNVRCNSGSESEPLYFQGYIIVQHRSMSNS